LNDPDLELLDAPHWQPNTSDGWVSFEAEQWWTNPPSGQRELLDVGIFVIQISFDAGGAIIGAVPGSRQLVVSESEFGGTITGHDWGADGRLLFSVRDAGANSGLWIADLTRPEASRYTWVDTGAARVVSAPAWSPDGSRVGFNENSTGIVILNLANGRRKTIPNSATYGVGTVRWSPNGDALIYHRGRYGEPQSDIFRADRDGGGRTYVATGSALGWRD
jgi:dipeptidyl aminopeptidase/acylaminoacyl peptidase